MYYVMYLFFCQRQTFFIKFPSYSWCCIQKKLCTWSISRSPIVNCVSLLISADSASSSPSFVLINLCFMSNSCTLVSSELKKLVENTQKVSFATRERFWGAVWTVMAHFSLVFDNIHSCPTSINTVLLQH